MTTGIQQFMGNMYQQPASRDEECAIRARKLRGYLLVKMERDLRFSSSLRSLSKSKTW